MITGEKIHKMRTDPNHRMRPTEIPKGKLKGKKMRVVAGRTNPTAVTIHQLGERRSRYDVIELLHHVYPG
jgi:redox-sensitive bicupin YhaK (pirin superfamily)